MTAIPLSLFWSIIVPDSVVCAGQSRSSFNSRHRNSSTSIASRYVHSFVKTVLLTFFALLIWCSDVLRNESMQTPQSSGWRCCCKRYKILHKGVVPEYMYARGRDNCKWRHPAKPARHASARTWLSTIRAKHHSETLRSLAGWLAGWLVCSACWIRFFYSQRNHRFLARLSHKGSGPFPQPRPRRLWGLRRPFFPPCLVIHSRRSALSSQICSVLQLRTAQCTPSACQCSLAPHLRGLDSLRHQGRRGLTSAIPFLPFSPAISHPTEQQPVVSAPRFASSGELRCSCLLRPQTV